MGLRRRGCSGGAEVVGVVASATTRAGIARGQNLVARYALDVHTDRAEDVLTHKRLLEEATVPEKRPVFHVRAIQLLPVDSLDDPKSPSGVSENSPMSTSKLAPLVFGSSANLEALAMDFNSKSMVHGNRSVGDDGHHSESANFMHLPMHEVTFSTVDKSELLRQMSALLVDVGLSIREAHLFSTTDGYSLVVFVVDGCPSEVTMDVSSRLAGPGRASYVEGPRRIVHAVVLEPREEVKYREVREPLSLFGLLQSPMGMMIGFTVLCVFLLPMLMNSTDPEKMNRF